MGRKFVFTIVLFITANFFGQTELSPGGIAVIQYNSDGPSDVIKFVVLTSLDAGTIIRFTDRGWRGDHFSIEASSEGIDDWTALSDISSGEVVEFSLANVGLGAPGDQLLVFQGEEDYPQFVFGLNNEGAGVWQADATNFKTSALPAGLTNGVNAVALDEVDNAMYAGITTGDRTQLLGAICNKDNWIGSNNELQSFVGSFSSSATYSGTWDMGSTSAYFDIALEADYKTNGRNLKSVDCTVKPSKKLTVDQGDVAIIESRFINNGDVIIESGGALVQTIGRGNNNSGNGKYIIKRRTVQLESEGEYTYWSSPVSSAVLGDVVNAQLNYSFDGATQSWVQETSGTLMVPGKGYALTGPQGVSYPTEHLASFEGQVNNGDIEIPVGFSDDGDTTNDANLLGNPYPSALDAEKFVEANENLQGTLYFWTHNSGDDGTNSVDDYVFWNSTGGTQICTECVQPNGQIAVGQGFFVQTIAGGTVTFTNDMRITERDANNLFFKGASKESSVTPDEEKDRVWLNLSSGNSFSQVLIGFIRGATDGIDRLYDAGRNLPDASEEDGFSFFAFANNDYFGILGQEPLTANEVVALGYTSNFSAEFEISLGDLEGLLKNATIELYDTETQFMHDLKLSPYVFTTETGLFKDRFELHIASDEVNIVDEVEILSVPDIYIESVDELMELRSDEEIKNIVIYDLLGRMISYEINHSGDTSITISTATYGQLLFLRIQLKSGRIVTRKIIH